MRPYVLRKDRLGKVPTQLRDICKYFGKVLCMRLAISRALATTLSLAWVVVYVLSSPTSSAAASTPDFSGELAKVADSNVAAGEVWAVNLRPGWASKELFKVVGAGTGDSERVRLIVSPSNTTSWMVAGERLTEILVKPEYRTVLRDAGLTNITYVALDSDDPDYLIAKSSYAVDASAKPAAVAAWLAEQGSVTRTSKGATVTYSARLAADVDLPPGVRAVFFPDRKHPVEVSVTVRKNVIVGYKFLVRTDDQPRLLNGTTTTPPATLTAPAPSRIAKLSNLVKTFVEADAPKNLLPAVLKQVQPSASIADLRTAMQKATVFTNVYVAATPTGAAVFPGYPLAQAEQFEEARCVDRGSSWTIRRCTPETDVLLDEKFAPYAEWVNDFTSQGAVSAVASARFYSSLNHQLWLYSGLRFTEDETAGWGWFLLNVSQRATTTATPSGN